MNDRLRVAQLNIGSLLEPDWERRRHEVVAWLDGLDPDIACLQEVWQDDEHQNTAGWLVEHSGEAWHWCGGGFTPPSAFDPPPGMTFGSAILSRWPIECHELFALPGADDSTGNPYEAVTMELLAARTAGIDVFSTHLTPMPWSASKRRVPVRFIDETVAEWRDPESPLPPVLCGDFNAEPDSDEIRFLCGLTTIDGRDTWWQEAWRATGRTDPGHTQRPENPLYARLNLPPKRIDYVLVGDTWLTQRRAADRRDPKPVTRGRILAAELAFHEPLTGSFASDHFGLIVEVSWPDKLPRPRISS